MNNNWRCNPKLSCFPKKKLEIVHLLLEQSQKKSLDVLLPDVIAIQNLLSQQNLTFTKEETAILMEVIEENMTPDEQQRFAFLKTFIS